MTAEEHNEVGMPEHSPFTSWTHDREIAVRRALVYGAGGILLRVPLGRPGPRDTWSWEHSLDIYGESEVLLRGSRIDVEVETL